METCHREPSFSYGLERRILSFSVLTISSGVFRDKLLIGAMDTNSNVPVPSADTEVSVSMQKLSII